MQQLLKYFSPYPKLLLPRYKRGEKDEFSNPPHPPKQRARDEKFGVFKIFKNKKNTNLKLESISISRNIFSEKNGSSIQEISASKSPASIKYKYFKSTVENL